MAKLAVDALAARAGGGAVYFRNQVRSLAELRPEWQFRVFCVKENLEDIRVDTPNVCLRPIGCASNSLVKRIAWQLTGLRNQLEGVDLLYSPGGFATPRVSVPQIVTFQNPNPFAPLTLQPTAQLKLKRWMQRRWSIWSILHADQVVFISKGYRDSVEDFTDLDNVSYHIIYSGIAPCFNEPAFSKKVEIGDLPDRYLLSVSNFRRHKNYEALFQAFKCLEDLANLRLVVAGNSSDESYYREMKRLLERLSLEERVILLGFVDHSQLPQLYREADCYTSTSILESFGLTPLEAMSCGVPVAISNKTVFPEICGDAALYFDPFSPEDIAAKIRKVLVDKEVADELREAGYRRVSSFSWKRNAQKLAKVFERVLSQ